MKPSIDSPKKPATPELELLAPSDEGLRLSFVTSARIDFRNDKFLSLDLYEQFFSFLPVKGEGGVPRDFCWHVDEDFRVLC